jgi:hypothetical protein
VQRDHLIEERTTNPGMWNEVIFKGPQFGIATPIAKQPPNMKNSDRPWDLVNLPDDAVPPTIYTRTADRESFLRAQERWVDHELLAELEKLTREDFIQWCASCADLSVLVGAGARLDEAYISSLSESAYRDMLVSAATRPYSDFYRLAWREMIPDNGERSLFAALLPPGVTHIHAVRSASLKSKGETVLQSGFWCSLPLDYYLRATGRGHLDVGDARTMPWANPRHPLADPLLLRALRLNCITRSYAPLWVSLYNESWLGREKWARGWRGLSSLDAIQREWCRETPLRTEYARRAALVEIDALVAVWLGIDADGLVAAYRSRYGVMADYEAGMWFDADGQRIAGRFEAYGNRQAATGRKKTFEALQGYLAAPMVAPHPEGYVPPFCKADREQEMREAHAVFQRRLDEAVARGEWDPVKQEVPKS